MVGTNERDAILSAISAWIRQRPGLEIGNYGNITSYRSELRAIGRELKEARQLLYAVEMRPSITADALREAFGRAYNGRLSWTWNAETGCGTLDYCVGQYWPTEYRRAACAVLASALWTQAREDMPEPSAYHAESWTRLELHGRRQVAGAYATKAEAQASLEAHGGRKWGLVSECYGPNRLSASQYLRRGFARQFGRGMASRWFA